MSMVRINDLMFDAKFFHSATLRAAKPPGSNQFAVCLIVTLLTNTGQKDYGVQNETIEETLGQFEKLLSQMGLQPMSEQERASLLAEKYLELEYYRAADPSKSPEAAQPVSQEVLQFFRGLGGEQTTEDRPSGLIPDEPLT